MGEIVEIEILIKGSWKGGRGVLMVEVNQVVVLFSNDNEHLLIIAELSKMNCPNHTYQ